MIVGVYEKKRPHLAAKVRNGFVPHMRDEILPSQETDHRRLPLVNLPEKKASRWDETLIAEKIKECRWVEPVLGCQVAFVEWTDGDKLRHCTFVGMRDEKTAAKVVREV